MTLSSKSWNKQTLKTIQYWLFITDLLAELRIIRTKEIPLKSLSSNGLIRAVFSFKEEDE